VRGKVGERMKPAAARFGSIADSPAQGCGKNLREIAAALKLTEPVSPLKPRAGRSHPRLAI
jgi:hypothetical protein